VCIFPGTHETVPRAQVDKQTRTCAGTHGYPRVPAPRFGGLAGTRPAQKKLSTTNSGAESKNRPFARWKSQESTENGAGKSGKNPKIDFFFKVGTNLTDPTMEYNNTDFHPLQIRTIGGSCKLLVFAAAAYVALKLNKIDANGKTVSIP